MAHVTPRRLSRITDDPGFSRILSDLLEQHRATTLPTQYDLDQLAQVTPRDIAIALALWDTHTAHDAPPLSGSAAPSRIKPALLALIAVLSARMIQTAQQYRSGDLTLRAWIDAQLALIKQATVAAGVAAYGGKRQFDSRAQQATAHAVRRQFAYQQRFTADVLDGSQRQNGRLDTRAALYAGSAWATYQALRRQIQRQAVQGFYPAATVAALHVDSSARYERNVLDASDSCSQCAAESARGWVPLGTLSLPGTRLCATNCHCDLEYAATPR